MYEVSSCRDNRYIELNNLRTNIPWFVIRLVPHTVPHPKKGWMRERVNAELILMILSGIALIRN